MAIICHWSCSMTHFLLPAVTNSQFQTIKIQKYQWWAVTLDFMDAFTFQTRFSTHRTWEAAPQTKDSTQHIPWLNTFDVPIEKVGHQLAVLTACQVNNRIEVQCPQLQSTPLCSQGTITRLTPRLAARWQTTAQKGSASMNGKNYS